MTTRLRTERRTADNSSLAKWRVTCFYDSLVVGSSAVLRLNFCAKNPPLRQAAKTLAAMLGRQLLSKSISKKVKQNHGNTIS